MSDTLSNSSYVQFGHRVDFYKLDAEDRWDIIHRILHGLIYLSSSGGLESVKPARIFNSDEALRLWGKKFSYEDQVVDITYVNNDLAQKRKCVLDEDTNLIPLCDMFRLNVRKGTKSVEKFLLVAKGYPFHFVELRRFMKNQEATKGFSSFQTIKKITITHVSEEYIKAMISRNPEIGLNIIIAVDRHLRIAVEEGNKKTLLFQQMLDRLTDMKGRIEGFRT